MIRDLCNSYAQHFNRTNERSGHVWQGRFNSKLVKNKKYFGDLVNYIYYNPIKHGLVKDVDDWPYLFIATPWG
jgi:REP element-mobilizing transposase RayT